MKVPKIKIGKRTMIAGGAVGALALLGFCTMQNNDAPDAPQPAASDAADAAAERARAERRRGEVTTIYYIVANNTPVSYEVAPDEPGPTIAAGSCAESGANPTQVGSRMSLKFTISAGNRDRIYWAFIDETALKNIHRRDDSTPQGETENCRASEVAVASTPAPAPAPAPLQ